MVYSVDRMEGERAVLVDETGSELVLLREKLAGAAVGDCGRLKEGVFVKDPQLTRLRRQEMRALRERLLSGKKKENKG